MVCYFLIRQTARPVRAAAIARSTKVPGSGIVLIKAIESGPLPVNGLMVSFAPPTVSVSHTI